MTTTREEELDVRKFPTLIVAILSLCMTLNVYTLVNLFPYVGVMVKDLLALETTNELGFYAGYVASAFTFGRFVSSYPLGQATDSVGRKPVIIAGLLSIMVFSLAFGLSPTFGFAITTRLVLGLTNGIALALRTTMREVCGEEHILQGMTYLNGGKAVSIVLGTGIGGLLAQPVLNFPTIFSGEGILGKYPFLLPNLVGACGALVLLPLVTLYVPETKDFDSPPAVGNLSSSRRGTTNKHSPEGAPGYGAVNGIFNGAASDALAYQPISDGSGTESLSQQSVGMLTAELQEVNGGIGDGHVMDDQKEPGVWGPDGLLAVPHVKMALLLVCVVQAVLIGFEEAYPLWALSTPDVGGLGWGPIEIGKVFLTAGLVGAVSQLVFFPRAVKALGITKWQRLGCILAVPAFIAVPCSKGTKWNDISLFFASVAGTSLVYCFMAMVNLSLSVASTSMVRSDMRGKMAGLFNMSESLGRFLGPAGFATMFAWSIAPSSYDWVDYHFVFLLAAFSMAVVAVLAWGTITHEHMMTSAERKVAVDIPVAGSGGNAQTAVEGSANPAERLI